MPSVSHWGMVLADEHTHAAAGLQTPLRLHSGPLHIMVAGDPVGMAAQFTATGVLITSSGAQMLSTGASPTNTSAEILNT